MKFSSTEFYESSAFLSHKLDTTYVSCNSMMGEKKKEKKMKRFKQTRKLAVLFQINKLKCNIM